MPEIGWLIELEIGWLIELGHGYTSWRRHGSMNITPTRSCTHM